MKTALFYLLSATSFASGKLPFEGNYGTYKVTHCKKIDASVTAKDYCTSKWVRIEQSPSCAGVPKTRILFAESNKQFETAPCTRGASAPAPVQENFSDGKGLNPDSYKYEKEEDGSDHFYDRVTIDEKSYLFTETWIKKISDKTVTLRLKKRETPKDDSQKTLMSFEYEFNLKPVN